MPKLLVSIRNPNEAELVAKIGVPYIDIKEPANGSLGMAKPGVIRKCFDVIQDINPKIEISCACGDVIEVERDAAVKEDIGGVSMVKMGLASLADNRQWKQRWKFARKHFEENFSAKDGFRWVAVVYADAVNARSPAAAEIISMAAESGCVGVLFDTFAKHSARLPDWIKFDRLIEYCEQIQSQRMFCAAAGQLRMEDVQRLASTPLDIVAVRSAACEKEIRSSKISERRVRELMTCLNEQRLSENRVP